MILQLNDIVGFKDNHWIAQQFNADMKRFTHDTYPEQDITALGKIVHLDYKDYAGQHRWQRLNINTKFYPEYDGESSEEMNRWWKIVRFDKDYIYSIDEVAGEEVITREQEDESTTIDNTVKVPGKAILIGPNNKIIVTSTAKIRRMWNYPGYDMSDNEFWLPRAGNWKKFNKERKLDFVHPVPVPNSLYMGIPVVTEYYGDILKYDSVINRLPESPDQHPTFEQLKEHLYLSDPELQEKKVPDVILKSFPLYYSRHEHHILDIPRRAINYGAVIRCDESPVLGGDSIVVAEIMDDNSIRYVTGSEAFIYFDDEHLTQPGTRVDIAEIIGAPHN